MRDLCSQIDQLSVPILKQIFDCGLEPIVIGGGHNNSYPILKALSQSTGDKVCAINLDPHADFRAPEGRHSGNGFSYAHKDGILHDYHVVALHELKNNQAIIDSLNQANFTFDSYQDIKVRQKVDFSESI